MTDPGLRRWADIAEQRIREAQDRGEFDDLPGAGKPLDLSDANDPDWWAKRRIREEGGDLSAFAPASVILRRERERVRAGVPALRSEQAVRDAVDAFNRLVLEDRLRPALPGMPPVVVRLLELDDALAAWREAHPGG
jgi:hypothetical protein